MDYPSLSLSKESIQNAFKVEQLKSNNYLQGQPKKDFHLKESTEQQYERSYVQIAISRKRHFRSPKRKNENTLQYKVPPKT